MSYAHFQAIVRPCGPATFFDVQDFIRYFFDDILQHSWAVLKTVLSNIFDIVKETTQYTRQMIISILRFDSKNLKRCAWNESWAIYYHISLMESNLCNEYVHKKLLVEMSNEFGTERNSETSLIETFHLLWIFWRISSISYNQENEKKEEDFEDGFPWLKQHLKVKFRVIDIQIILLTKRFKFMQFFTPDSWTVNRIKRPMHQVVRFGFVFRYGRMEAGSSILDLLKTFIITRNPCWRGE